MAARLHPGVYVEEVPSGARSIEAAGTSTAIFVGETERGPTAPTKIKGIADFERLFGGYKRHAEDSSTKAVTLRYAVDGFFKNGGTSAYILRAVVSSAKEGSRTTANGVTIKAASPGKWSDNVSVAIAPSSDKNDKRFRVFVLYQSPGSDTRSIVEMWDRLSVDPKDESYAADVLQRSLYVRWVPNALPVVPTRDTNIENPKEKEIAPVAVAFSGGSGGLCDYPTKDDGLTSEGEFSTLLKLLDEIDDASLLVVPARIDAADGDVEAMAQAALDYAEARPRLDLFAIADMPRLANKAPTDAATAAVTSLTGNIKRNTTFGAVYFPWVEINDPVGVGRDPTTVIGPSGFVAGLYARTDQRRGVWKAPAGLEASVLNVRRLDYKLLDVHQDDLNPLGINALRALPAGGNVVWGARTLQPSSEWRYIPVRRMAIFLRTSIYNGIQWAVFEPNDEPLWAALRLTIGGFMDQLFRQGAFAGRTTREAFFVKCDAETTPETDQMAGIVNVWVGFAPLRPAEFVVVKLSQIVKQTA